MKERFPSTILATCCVPWNENGSFAEEMFRRQLLGLLQNLTRDIFHDPEFPLRLLPPYSSFSDETFQNFLELVCGKYPRWLD